MAAAWAADSDSSDRSVSERCSHLNLNVICSDMDSIVVMVMSQNMSKNQSLR